LRAESCCHFSLFSSGDRLPITLNSAGKSHFLPKYFWNRSSKASALFTCSNSHRITFWSNIIYSSEIINLTLILALCFTFSMGKNINSIQIE
jgi:hypothetical protein